MTIAVRRRGSEPKLDTQAPRHSGEAVEEHLDEKQTDEDSQISDDTDDLSVRPHSRNPHIPTQWSVAAVRVGANSAPPPVQDFEAVPAEPSTELTTMQFGEKHVKIAGVVAFYFFVSISLVFTNKVLMSSDSISVPAPMFVTWFQCVVTVVVCWVMGTAGKGAKPGSFMSQFPEFKLDLGVAKQVLPLSLIFVGMVMFNNLTLKYVEVSFYNVARSLTIVFNVVFTFFMLGDTTSYRVLGTLVMVILGFLVGSGGEVNFSLLGSIFGISASAFVSLNSIYTRKVLPAVQGDKWRLTAYNNINACIIFIPLMIVTGELDTLTQYADVLVNPAFWGAMLVSGAFGTLIGIASVLQIQTTSPLTHNISGTAKAAVQSILAVQIWHNEMTGAAWLGLVLVLGGSLTYAYVRKLEMDSTPKAPPAPSALAEAVPGEEEGEEGKLLERTA